jgi:hypothetical protein
MTDQMPKADLFCELPQARVVVTNDLAMAMAIRDRLRVSSGGVRGISPEKAKYWT